MSVCAFPVLTLSCRHPPLALALDKESPCLHLGNRGSAVWNLPPLSGEHPSRCLCGHLQEMALLCPSLHMKHLNAKRNSVTWYLGPSLMLGGGLLLLSSNGWWNNPRKWAVREREPPPSTYVVRWWWGPIFQGPEESGCSIQATYALAEKTLWPGCWVKEKQRILTLCFNSMRKQKTRSTNPHFCIISNYLLFQFGYWTEKSIIPAALLEILGWALGLSARVSEESRISKAALVNQMPCSLTCCSRLWTELRCFAGLCCDKISAENEMCILGTRCWMKELMEEGMNFADSICDETSADDL